jgi:hypothetical protein
MLINNQAPMVLPYDRAIDLAFTLNENDDWHYHVEIDATTGKAKIAVFDGEIKLGYL